MDVVNMTLDRLSEAPWNPNVMDFTMMSRLRESIVRYGLVENLVVRPLQDGCYEILSGNQRLQVLKELGCTEAPCVVVDLDDAHTRLLAQAVNHIQGQDDLGMRAELVREVLAVLPEEKILSVLPETSETLRAMASLGQETMAGYLEAWQKAQAARLKHLQFQLTPDQLEVIEEALARVMPMARESMDGSPNVRGTSLFLLCRTYLETVEKT